MFETTLIERLILFSVHPFGRERFDFRDPESGETLRSVCLHGPNGCGKSVVLSCLRSVLDPAWTLPPDGVAGPGAFLFAKLSSGEESRWLARGLGPQEGASEGPHWFLEDLEGAEAWGRLDAEDWDLKRFLEAFSDWRIPETPLASDDALVFLGGESERPGAGAADETAWLEEAVCRARRDRDQAFLSYLAHPQSQERSVAEVREHFDALEPDPLEEVRRFWGEATAEIGLALVTEPRLAFRSAASGRTVAIESVSPSLRRLLRSAFVGRLGRPEAGERGARFLLIDSPESGLGGDLPSGLARFLLEAGRRRGAQTFVATLSPEVAALFSEGETRRLRFDGGRSACIAVAAPERESEVSGDDADVDGESEVEEDGGGLPVPPGFASLGALKRAIQETEDQEELADLIDRLVSMRGR